MRIFLLSTIIFLSSCSSSDDAQAPRGDGELWVMVKIDSNFRSEKDLEIIDVITEEIERKNLGILDGHSSGAHQLDFNFVEISDIETTKKAIISSIDRLYPTVEYTVSTTYEVTYETL